MKISYKRKISNFIVFINLASICLVNSIQIEKVLKIDKFYSINPKNILFQEFNKAKNTKLLTLSQIPQENTDLRKLETKDLASIIISILALLLSIYANINTEIKTRSETSRTIRLQLTDILDRIIKLELENAKYQKDYNNNDSDYTFNISSILNQQNVSLLQQANYLSRELKEELISVNDFITIAVANQRAGFLVEADDFYNKATKKAKNISDRYSEAVATRAYANFLFLTGKIQDGRNKYENSISVLQSLPTQGQNDLIPYQLALTHQYWGVSESSINNKDSARINFNNARNEFKKITNPFARNQNLEIIDKIEKNMEEGIKEKNSENTLN